MGTAIATRTRATLSAPTTPLTHCGAFAPAVADHLHVGSEQLAQPVDVALAEGVEEPVGQRRALPPVGLEPGPALVHMAASPHGELPDGRLRPPHRRRDLGEAEAEDLPQHEHRPLQGAEPLQ
jgi:hypothetical protein